MWLVGFRDLQWRRKRFFIAVLATALLFSVTLLLSGISAFFHNEVTRTIHELDVDAWIVPTGTTGPFTSATLFPEAEGARVAQVAGVTRADPILLFRETVLVPKPKTLNIIGYAPGASDSLASPVAACRMRHTRSSSIRRSTKGSGTRSRSASSRTESSARSRASRTSAVRQPRSSRPPTRRACW